MKEAVNLVLVLVPVQDRMERVKAKKSRKMKVCGMNYLEIRNASHNVFEIIFRNIQLI